MTQYDPAVPTPGDHGTATPGPAPYQSGAHLGVPYAPSAAQPAVLASSAAPGAAALVAAGSTEVDAVERVGRGVLFSLLAVPVAVVATVVIWKLGYIASISSFLLAALAAWLYTAGAGAPPRRGVVAVIGVVLAGIAISFFAVVGSDLVDVYDSGVLVGDFGSRTEFVAANLFHGPVLAEYGMDLVMFVGFAALGVFSVLRRLTRGR